MALMLRHTDEGAPRTATPSLDLDDARDARQLRLRPVHRTMLTIITGLLCGALLVTTAVVLAGRPDGEVSQLRQRVEVAANALTLTHESLGKGSDEFRLAFATDDLADRAELLALASTSSAQAASAWKTYNAATLNLPGEKALSSQYDAGVVQQTQDVLNFLNAPPPDPAAADSIAAQLTRANRALLLPLEQLRALYISREKALLRDVAGGMDRIVAGMLIMLALLGALWAPIIYVTMRGASTEERWLRSALRQRQETTRRAQLDSQIQRALEMTRTEDGAYGVVSNAMRASMVPGQLGEFLVADSSRAHFRQVSGTGEDGEGPGCPVGGPADCPATNGGQTLVFASSAALDTCPWLRDRQNGACSATCVPVAIAGRTIGVLHVTGPVEAPPDNMTVQDLELVARKAGERIGMLRAFARTETEARTDPLTGLLNRRSLENRVRRLAEQGVPYVVAFADLDHFKELNTAYGHETGDRALRIFSRTLRDSIRPDDIPARWGGEEFVTLLPDCRIEDARIVAERLRERLGWVLERGDVPHFTVSIGLAASEDGVTFSEVLAAADDALMQAKAGGRDVVVLAAPHPESSAPKASVVTLPIPHAEVATTAP
jgi:diguanylate cyclase (GGDEF)-like protein